MSAPVQSGNAHSRVYVVYFKSR